jgi:hypothetical protein
VTIDGGPQPARQNFVRFDPITGDPAQDVSDAGALPFFNMAPNGTGLHGAAIADALKMFFVVETNTDLNLYAVPLDGTTPAGKVPLGHSGQAVYFEPTSSTVFAPFNQGDGFDFSAYRVTAGSPPTLAKRQAPEWSPPTDLRPLLLEMRRPLPVQCP